MSTDEDKSVTELTVQQKIEKIRSCADYRQMAWDWFPPAHSDEYYFVSYSHRDYKEVFEDIYKLQGEGLHVWYDRELRPGKDWEIEARAHIYDFKCKGVIFYVSENSVASRSIHKEIEFVKRSGKSYLSINLPVNGEYLSAAEILRLIQPAVGKDGEKFTTLERTFGNGVTYLKLSEEPRARAQRIRSALVSLPLLKFEVTESEYQYEKPYATVTGINDLNAIAVNAEDFIYRDEKGDILPVKAIGDCAFSNCCFLETITLPDTVRKIGEFAFLNCSSLLNIVIPPSCLLGAYAFKNCGSVTIMHYSGKANKTHIADGIFAGCSSLKKATLPVNADKISDNMFNGCRLLENIDIPSDVSSIGDGAFGNCRSLKKAVIPHGVSQIGKKAFGCCLSLEDLTIGDGVQKIGDLAFYLCSALSGVTLGHSVAEIGTAAFMFCNELKEIKYNGKIKEWIAIKKEATWDMYMPDYVVYCTDGEIHKNGNVVRY